MVLVEMQPGPDGVHWYLCIRDYFDGIFPGKLGRIPARYRDDMEVTTTTRGEAVIPSTGQKVPWELHKREPAGLSKKKRAS